MKEQLTKVRNVIKNKMKTDKNFWDLHYHSLVGHGSISGLDVVVESDQEWEPVIKYTDPTGENSPRIPFIVVGENWSGFNDNTVKVSSESIPTWLGDDRALALSK